MAVGEGRGRGGTKDCAELGGWVKVCRGRGGEGLFVSRRRDRHSRSFGAKGQWHVLEGKVGPTCRRVMCEW